MPILPPSRFFPPAEHADPLGLVGFGGDLSTEWLIDAYRHGIFPWPMDERDDPVPWFSPDPRAVLPLDRVHVPQRLARTMRSGRFTATIDRDFAGVIRHDGAGTGQQRGADGRGEQKCASRHATPLSSQALPPVNAPRRRSAS